MTTSAGRIGTPFGHTSANLHVTGEALYTDDVPDIEGTLYAAIGSSSMANARIIDLDLSKVSQADGVVAVLTAQSIEGANNHGHIVEDEPIFASDTVGYAGQSLFAVIGDSIEQARHAASLAEVRLEVLQPFIDIESAMAAGSLMEPSVEVERGNAELALNQAPHRLIGQLRTGGQEHFYLEGQVALAIPDEGGCIRIICSTQNPTDTQRLAARALGIKDNQVTVNCQRMGGGFGGKETQAALFACIAAIAARKTGRPVKLRLRRDEDMIVTGKRHDFVIDYSVGFDDVGSLKGLLLTLSSRCGYSADLSTAVNTRALLHCDNCYFLENMKLVSHRYRTHTAPNTAFRGFGAPQAVLAIETVMDAVAGYLNIDPTAVRRKNFYSQTRGNMTHYGMKIEDNILEPLVHELETRACFRERLREIENFNAEHEILKRGIALTPVKFGISFTQTSLNYAGALVHVYTDGSVLLSHGGVEMGQGLHTKVIQVVADELGIDPARIRCDATDTSMVANSAPTAASTSSDLNGKAAQAAARTIKRRLRKYAARVYNTDVATVEFRGDRVRIGSSSLPFDDLVRAAHAARISLSATGHYRTPKIHFDPVTFSGRPFYYFVYGAAVCEVTIDTLTGEHRVERVDILQDAGRSLNPTIDISQIEGGFMQGLGWLTSEELYWRPDGVLETVSPSTYKIPTSHDWPREFNVNLVAWSLNKEDTIFRSKGIGEPPLLLAISAFLAIKDAIARAVANGERPDLHAPATPEQVLTAIETSRTG